MLCIIITSPLGAITNAPSSIIPSLSLFETIQLKENNKGFVEDAIYFKLNKKALSKIHQQKKKQIRLQIPFGATKKLDVNLSQTNFLATDFKINVQGRNIYNTLSYSPNLYYRGTISGVKDALIAISFSKEAIAGVLSLNSENYNIGKYKEDIFVIYKERNLYASNPFSCSTEDPEKLQINRSKKSTSRSNNKVQVYVECDYHLFVANGQDVQKTSDFATGLFNIISTIYERDGIQLEISELKIWTESDPYDNSSARAARNDFGAKLNGNFNGDIAHLLSNYKVNGVAPNGGSANIDALCDKEKAVGYTNITTSYQDYPVFSWTAYAVTHEIGHNLGSPHTHSCLWPSGPIDDCWCPEGDCDIGPSAEDVGGTIMSYCHLRPQWTNDCELSVSNPGIDLAKGFGAIPGALIRERIANASCLSGNSGGGVVFSFQASSNAKDETCGQSNGRIEALPSYGQTPYSFLWNTGARTREIEGLVAGNYSCTVSDATGKTVIISESIQNTGFIELDLGADQAINCKQSEVVLDASESIPGFAYEFEWTKLGGHISGNTKTKTVTVSESGTYVLSVKNTDTQCQAKDTIIVFKDMALPTFTLASDGLDCNQQSTYIRTTFTSNIVSYYWTGPNGFYSESKNPSIREGGKYTFYATGANGCQTEKSIEIQDFSEIPEVSLKTDAITCEQANVQLKTTTTLDEAIYEWTGPRNFKSTEKNPIVSIPGLYHLVITSPSGCKTTASIEVLDQKETPTLEVIGGVLTCAQPNIQLKAITSLENVTYSWGGPNNFQSSSPTPTVSQPGIYAVIIRTASGCRNEQLIEVKEEKGGPQFSAKGGTLDCNNTTITFQVRTAAENLTYEWSGPHGFSSTEKTPVTNRAGTYFLTAKSENGCVTKKEVLVDENKAAPSLGIKGDDLTCANPTVVLQGLSNDPINAYQWERASAILSTAQNLEVKEAGVYELRVTGKNGCVSTETFNVHDNAVPPKVEVTAHDIDCSETSGVLKVLSDEANLTFMWEGPANFSSSDKNLVVNTPGTYVLTVENENACRFDTVLEVKNIEQSIIRMEPPALLSCEKEQVLIDASKSLLTENAVGEWTTVDGNIVAVLDDLRIEVNQVGTYALTIRDTKTECVKVQTIEVKGAPTIAAKIKNDQILTCNQPTVLLSAKEGNYSENTVFKWETQNGNILSDAEQIDIRVDEPGVYMLLAKDTVTGCLDAAITSVVRPVIPQVVMDKTALLACDKSTVILNGIGSVLNENTIIEWEANGVLIQHSNSLTLTVNKPGKYTLILRDTLHDCQSRGQIAVSQPTAPKVIIADSKSKICKEGEGFIALNIESDFAYDIKWNTGQTTAIIDQLEAGEYVATVTNSVGCQTVVSKRVEAAKSISLGNVQMQNVSCNGANDGEIDLVLKGGNAPLELQWSNGEIGHQTKNLTPGIHTLEVVDALGCFNSFEFEIKEPEALVASLEILGNDVIVNVSGGTPDYEYAWSNGSTDNYATNLKPGLHFVKVKDANACQITQSFEIDQTTYVSEVEQNTLEVQAYPNPTSDYFMVQQKFLNNEPAIELSVYDAQGKQVNKLLRSGGQIDEKIITKDWEPGTYFLTVSTKTKFVAKKIQVIKK
jgi:hypothetical protein